jgi:hypothetical protein
VLGVRLWVVVSGMCYSVGGNGLGGSALWYGICILEDVSVLGWFIWMKPSSRLVRGF